MTESERLELYFRRAYMKADQIIASINNCADKHTTKEYAQRLKGYLECVWDYFDWKMKEEEK